MSKTAKRRIKLRRRKATNLTLPEDVRREAASIAATRYNESLSVMVERLLRGEMALARDRERKAVA